MYLKVDVIISTFTGKEAQSDCLLHVLDFTSFWFYLKWYLLRLKKDPVLCTYNCIAARQISCRPVPSTIRIHVYQYFCSWKLPFYETMFVKPFIVYYFQKSVSFLRAKNMFLLLHVWRLEKCLARNWHSGNMY